MDEKEKKSSQNKTRPPIVVVLGHVDHGKTRLLDTIRKTKVAEKESGGITQHIGAYQVDVNGKFITFLDTPGHEAFSAIRSRGAKVADVAILVIAADEGVKPQTIEAIQIIKESKIPFVVVINKIDKEGSNPQKVRQDLSSQNVLVEGWGGKIPVVEISAKSGRNIDELLDMILLVTELEELEEDLTGPATGVLIESYLDKQRGYIATVLVQKGILNLGNWIAAETTTGKIRSMENFASESIDKAYPSQPVRITGWSSSPDTGREFVSSASKKEVEHATKRNVNLSPLLLFLKESMPTSDSDNKDKKILNIIFKADVSSSLEAIESSLEAIKSEDVGCSVIHYGIGTVTERDIKTAIATESKIFGFRVGIEMSAQKLAEKEKMEILTFDIIYELIETVRNEMAELLEPEIRRTTIGKLRTLALFKLDGKIQILGGKVISGKIIRGTFVDITAGNESTRLGKIVQLQQDKKDVPEVREGLEAGLKIGLENQEIAAKEGDVLEIYEEEKVKRSL